MYYIKALHIIFVVTWFAGLFYMPRLLIYNVEAQEKEEPEKSVLTRNFSVMMKRLWFGITWPSAILTLIMGPLTMFLEGWNKELLQPAGRWLLIKLLFVIGLYGYHCSLQHILKTQLKGNFKYTGQQLRMWNELATVFLFAIVFLAVVKEAMSFVWGLVGIILLVAILMIAIKIYKRLRNKSSK